MSDRKRPDHERERDEREDEVPEPDAEVSPAEEARAESFARLVDGLVSGEPLPPAMDSEDRALLEAATVVVASTREVGIDEERKHAVIDEALERAVLGRRRPSSSAPIQVASEKEEPRAEPLEEGGDVVSLAERRRGRALRLAPWALASVAAAAAIFLFVTRPQAPAPQAARPAPPRLSDVQRSRPADALVGMIQKEEAARAGERLDTIFADRMAGYRSLYFRRKLGGPR